MISIFKGARNGRFTFDWKDFNQVSSSLRSTFRSVEHVQAMTELEFEVTQTGVALAYVIPPRWGAGVLVLHMVSQIRR